MDEFDPTAEDAARVGHAVKHILMEEWGVQVAGGHLTKAGLAELRGRLDPAAREFDCAHSRLLLGRVIRALAPLRGMDSPAEDDLWECVWASEAVWAGFADGLPRTPAEIDWHRRW